MRADAVMVPIRVQMLNTETGERRTFEDELYTTPDYDGLFIWDEGNYGCDCNRHLFFGRAAGIEPHDGVCGQGKYVVESIVRLSDGELLYSEPEK